MNSSVSSPNATKTTQMLWRCLAEHTYLADKLFLSAHEGDAVFHWKIQLSLGGLFQRKIKFKPRKWKWETEKVRNHPHISFPPLNPFLSPLVKFRVEIFPFGGGSPLGGCLLIREEDKGNIWIGSILGTRGQASAGFRHNVTCSFTVVGEKKLTRTPRMLCRKPARVNSDEEPVFLSGVANG